MQDLISVIVPVYKVEKYLKRCVDSILAQTYPCLEVPSVMVAAVAGASPGERLRISFR